MSKSTGKKLSVLRSEIQLGFEFSFDENPDPSACSDSKPSARRKVVTFPGSGRLVDKPQTAASNRRGRPKEVESNDYVWTDEEIIAIRVGLLQATLEELEDPRTRNKKERCEWIKSTDVSPFSFHLCCIAAGHDPDQFCSAAGYDPDQIRDELLSHVEEAPWVHSNYS